jgi:hypothetical protein
MASPIGAAVRRIPWATVVAVGTVAARKGSAAWNALTPRQRRELADLVRKSKGRPSNLTKRQQYDARRLARKVIDAAREA